MSGEREPFEPVATLADLETLDSDEIVDGYRSAERGDPEPGANRGRAYWHGWCNWMRDMGELPQDEASCALAREYVASLKPRVGTAIACAASSKGGGDEH